MGRTSYKEFSILDFGMVIIPILYSVWQGGSELNE